jgi:RNA polymerase sigma-70 factor (ECF subfamily)
MSAVNICGEIEDDSGGCTLNYPGQPVEISTIPDQSEKSRFEKLFIPLLDNLYNMALRMTRNPNDAEDLVQETYLKAYKFFDSFRINTNARAWIMTIMMNTFRTGYRKSRKEPAKVDFEDVENFLPGDEDDLVKRPANKSELRDLENITEYMRSIVSDDIIKALESVPIRFRLPVLLSDAEQFNYQEISEILGINMGTVKSRIFRGRKLLKSSLFEFAVEKGICRRR